MTREDAERRIASIPEYIPGACVGKAADTASHWLCQEHLEALTRDRDKFYETGDRDAMKRMVGKAIRGMGGAKAATCSMVGHDWEQINPTTERCMRCGKEMPV